MFGNNFGLGLVLTLTDNATAGLTAFAGVLSSTQQQVERLSPALQGLSNAFSAIAGLGGTLTVGLTTPVTAFMTKITQFGVARASFVQDTKLAFSTLMGSASEASTYLNQLMDFAKTTPFTYESITSAAQNMISVGIDSTKILGDTMNNFQGGLLKALGDVAGATGQGASGFQYYADVLGKVAAEGKISSMRLDQLSRAGLNLSNVLGKSEEELKKLSASDLIDDIITNVNQKYDGMMAGLKKTWTGAKDTFTSALKTAGLNLLGAYTDEEGVVQYKFLERMTDALNKVSAAIKKLSPLLQPLMDFFGNVMDKGSALIEKFGNYFANASDETKSRLSKLVSTLVLLGPALIIVGKAGRTLIPIISGLVSVFKAFFTKASGVLKLVPLFATLGIAWATDFAGIRTTIKNGVTFIVNAFKTAKTSVNGSIDDIRNTVQSLDRTKFGGKFTYTLMQLMMTWNAVVEGWNDFTLSEETFEKAKELGVLPLIEAIFNLKYRFDNFVEGFKKGWKAASDAVKRAFDFIKQAFKGTFIETFIDKLTAFFNIFSSGDASSWEKFGEVVGKLVPILLPLVSVLTLLNKVTKPFASGGGLLGRVFGGKKGGGKGGVTDSVFSNPMKMLKAMGSVAIMIGGFTAIVTALGALASLPAFSMFISQGVDILAKLGSSMLAVLAIVGVMSLLTLALDKLKVSPKKALVGLANIAIMLLGLEAVVLAMGALVSIPFFDEFMSKGTTTLIQLSTVLLPIILLAGVMTGFAFAMEKLKITPKTALKGLANLALMLLGLEGIVVAMGAIVSIPYFDEFLSKGTMVFSRIAEMFFKIESLGIAGAIAGICVLGLIPLPVVLMGILALAVILAALTLVIVAFGALSHIPGFDDFIERGGDTMALVFAQIGKAMGAVVEAFTERASGSLGTIGENLSQFAENAKPFFEIASSFDMDKITPFIQGLSSLGAVAFLQTFDLGKSEMVKLGENLAGFALTINDFFINAAMIGDTTKGEELMAKGDQIASFINAINTWDTFGPNTRLDIFGLQMSALAVNIKGFFDNAPQNVSNADAFTAYTVDKLPDVVNAINTWDTFGPNTDLAKFGTLMTGYSQNMRGFFAYAPQNVDKANGLAEFTTDKVPGLINGINTWDTFGPNTDLAWFGVQMTWFAKNMIGFFNAAASIGDMSGGERLAAQAGNIETLVNAANSWDTFGPNTDLGMFGYQLSAFAANIQGFFIYAARITPKEYVAVNYLADSMKNMSVVVDIANKSVGSLAKFGLELVNFGEYVAMFFSKASSLGDGSSVSVIAKALEELAKSFDANSGQISYNSHIIVEALKGVSSQIGIANADFYTFRTKMTEVTSVTTTFQSAMTSQFALMATNVKSSIYTIKSEIESLLTLLKNADMSIPQKTIKLPHFSVEKGFDLEQGKVPEYKVEWYAKGGVFDEPSLIGVGEKGTEAVMPLEKNTEWIDVLATKLDNKLKGLSVVASPTMNTEITPVADTNSYSNGRSIQAPISTGGGDSYDSHNTESVVNINEGAIQIKVANATQAEAKDMAEYIMKYIQRKNELNRMANYR